MPGLKGDFGTPYGYLLYEPADILDPDYTYIVGEITRLVQGLSPRDNLAEGIEDRIIQWMIPWIVTNQEDFVTNDPRSGEPDYFGLHPDTVPEADEE